MRFHSNVAQLASESLISEFQLTLRLIIFMKGWIKERVLKYNGAGFADLIVSNSINAIQNQVTFTDENNKVMEQVLLQRLAFERVFENWFNF